jgi:Carboxypeptidase regulatory-like domain
MKKAWIGTLCFLLLHFYSASAYGQATSRVAGTVQDKTGAVVVGAAVTLTNEATNVAVSTVTTSAGTYIFDGIVPGTYTIAVVAQGFATFASKHNTLTIAQPMVVNALVQVGEASEKVEVTAGAELVQTENSGDLGALVDQRALETLPVVGARGRSPLDLIEVAIPGVVDGGPLNTEGANIEGGGVYVNGSRDRAWNYTLDGIDINETSAPGSNFSPLRTNPDSIEGFRVITTNANADYGVTSGGQVILETRPGTNDYHGKVFWFYQTPGLNANDPGNKENGIGRPQFVQHIPGFSFGGPIFKNKTFFFVNTQLLHASQAFTITSLVYTQAARNGMIRYVTNPAGCGNSCPFQNTPAGSPGASVDASGNPIVPISTYNVAADDYAKRGLDPSIQGFIGLTPLPNNFTVGDGLNTAGYTFLAPEQERQVDFTVRVDHNFNSKNSIFGRWAHGHQNTIGDIVNGGLQPFPKAPNVVNTDRQPRNLAISWRYTLSSKITNEVIAGMNRFIFNFVNPDSHFASNPPFLLNGDGTGNNPFLTSPLQNYVGNLRALTTIQLVDNLSYIRGQHAFKFGTNLRYQRHIDDRGSIGNYDASPIVFFNTDVDLVNNCPPSPPAGTQCFHLPNDIDGTFDLQTLKNSINNLLGRVGNIQQGLVALNANQYAPPGAHLSDDFRIPEYDFYALDSWKIRPNLTVNVGLRWEIKLSPRVGPNFLLHPDQPFNVGAAPADNLTWVPGKLYKDAWKNFAPSFGIAWDPFKNGKQSVRADYRLAYDRMNTFVLSSSLFEGMPGETLQNQVQSFGKAGGRIADGLPSLAAPSGLTPISLRQPPSFSTTSITAMDPNWTPPQVHEWSLSIQRQVGHDTVLELAYVGHHAVHLFGGYDSNQAQFRNNGFLNAFNAVAAGQDSPLIDQLLSNDPGRIAANETGSVYLADPNSPYFTQFSLGSVAAVAQEIGIATDAGGVPLPVSAGLSPNFFFKYPQYAGGFIVLDSGDWSWYNGLQATYRGRFHGLQFQTNYTWSKSMDTRSFDPTFGTVIGGSSTFGSSSSPFDNTNRSLNYAPSDFDRTHVLQGVWTYEVPFGKDRKWGRNWGSAFDRLVGGWEVAGSVVAESGRPTTIYSPAFTTSSIVRTPASCTDCTPGMLSVHFNPDTGGLNYFTTAQMNMFTTPGPGQFSNLGRNFFRLGRYNVMNLSLGKVTRLAWNHTFELRVEMQNALNSKHYDEPASIRTNSSVFGAVDAATVENFCCSPGSNPRTIQLSGKYSF